MPNKLTKRDYFKMILEVVEGNEQLTEFVNHELELLDKKASSKSMTSNQKENEQIKARIVQALVELGRPVTITELQANNGEMAQYSNQKLSALIKQMVRSEDNPNGEITRAMDKKKAYFSIAD